MPPAGITPHSLLHGVPDEVALETHAAILVGGSGDYSVLGKEPFLREFFDFLSSVVLERAFPTFASCFGFQGLVLAAGGDVVRDVEGAEVGTYELVLTKAGKSDPLMRTVGATFLAQLGHKDRADRLPAGMVNMATSERSPFQALRVEGTSIFATQFHPELTREDNEMRYRTYWESYGGGPTEEDPVILSLRDSPETSALLPLWVEETFGANA
jgi:GMP synthase (glutamine-hydrolysing)